MNKFFIIIILLFLFIFEIFSYDEVLISVGKQSITKKELELLYGQLKQTTGNQAVLNQQQRVEYLQELINELIFLNGAYQKGISIQLQEINEAIQNFQNINNLNSTDLDKLFKLQNIDYKYFQEQFRKKILVEKFIQQEIVENITVTQSEIQKEYNKKYQQEQDAFYYLWYIFKNKDFKDAKKEILALKKILTKNNFQELAQIHSQHPSSSQKGVLAPLKKEDMLTEISIEIEKIKVGDITPLIETETGYHLFYLADIQKKNNFPDFSSVKIEISNEIFNKKYQNKLNDYTKNLKEKYPVNIRDNQLKKLLLEYEYKL